MPKSARHCVHCVPCKIEVFIVTDCIHETPNVHLFNDQGLEARPGGDWVIQILFKIYYPRY